MAQKSLDKGIAERSEDRFPSDWPCTCGHRKDEHNWTFPQLLTDVVFSACVVRSNVRLGFADVCRNFAPIDNLTYIELLAKDKEALK